LRSLLAREVDFELLASQRKGVPQVFVCATNVRTGRGEIFAGPRLSADAVMASACLPLMFSAVRIEGELYWDGGYSGNPALYPLIYQTECSDILLVQINPIEHLGVPDTMPEIMDRMNEITFNASLLAELRAIEFVRRLLAEGKLDPRRYKNVRMHRIDGGTPAARPGFCQQVARGCGLSAQTLRPGPRGWAAVAAGAPRRCGRARHAGSGAACMNESNPLWRCAPSPFSRIAAQFGKGDAPSTAGRPLRGSPGIACARFLRCGWNSAPHLFLS
jgi:hypothetical protein